MAQADSVPSAVRVLITGASAKPSTSPFPPDHEIIVGRERQPAGSLYLHPCPVHFKDSTDRLTKVLCALSPYSTGLDEPAPKIAVEAAAGRAA
jgi:hypothetical protein